MARVSGLGRGLSSLIPVNDLGENDSSLQNILISSIQANRFQPRRVFEDDGIASLAESIAAIGVLQPILVRKIGQDEYELIAGERRLRAARRAGLDQIPAVIQEANDLQSLERAIVENLHRQDLNPLEEAGAYKQLIDDFSLTHEEVARRVGKSRAAISNALRILQLPTSVQRLLSVGSLSAGHARAILGIPDRSLQERFAEEIAARDMTVREVEEKVRLLREVDEDADGEPSRNKKSTDKRLVKGAGGDKPAGVAELEEILEDVLETSVSVVLGSTSKSGIQGGRISISFGSVEDLERIFRRILDQSQDT